MRANVHRHGWGLVFCDSGARLRPLDPSWGAKPRGLKERRMEATVLSLFVQQGPQVNVAFGRSE